MLIGIRKKFIKLIMQKLETDSNIIEIVTSFMFTVWDRPAWVTLVGLLGSARLTIYLQRKFSVTAVHVLICYFLLYYVVIFIKGKHKSGSNTVTIAAKVFMLLLLSLCKANTQTTGFDVCKFVRGHCNCPHIIFKVAQFATCRSILQNWFFKC